MMSGGGDDSIVGSQDVTWMASTFTGCPGGLDDHDVTFAPPNSPMNPSHMQNGHSNGDLRRHINIPYINKNYNHGVGSVTPTASVSPATFMESLDKASPIVGGVLDNTWLSYTDHMKMNGSITTTPSAARSAATPIPINSQAHSNFRSRTPMNKDHFYPYYPLSHDLTFRGGMGANGEAASSVSSNQFLNESNFELLQTSLLESSIPGASSGTKKKRKKSSNLVFDRSLNSLAGEPVGDGNVFEEEENNNNKTVEDQDEGEDVTIKPQSNSTKILQPIISIFLNSKSGDQLHILNCIKELLVGRIISPADLCIPEFLSKSAEMMTTKENIDEDTLFHLVTLFEKHLLPNDEIDKNAKKLISQKCRIPLGKLALAGNEELSTRAEKCLGLLNALKE